MVFKQTFKYRLAKINAGLDKQFNNNADICAVLSHNFHITVTDREIDRFRKGNVYFDNAYTVVLFHFLELISVNKDICLR